MAENLTEFEPSENQRRVLAAFQGKGYLCTVEDGCKLGGVTRQPWYEWFDNPGFAAWWQMKAETWFARQLPRVQAALVSAATSAQDHKAAKYNPKAIELFLQRFDKGFIPASKQISEVQVDVTSLDNRTAELLAAYLEQDTEGANGERGPADEGAEGG